MIFSKKTTKALAVLLALTMLPVFAASCVDKGTGKDQTGDVTTSAGTELSDNLPARDYNGEEFLMLVRTERLSDFYADDTATTNLSRAVYNRNLEIENRFNIKLKFRDMAGASGTDIKSAINNSVLSGTSEYDLVAPDYWWGLETSGYFYNLYDMEYINLDAPWWCQGWNDNAAIDGVLQGAVGWYTLDMIRNMEVVYFNKSMIGSYNLENPYELVKSKTWTLDKMNIMSNTVAEDLNQDGKYDANDKFGTILNLQSGRGILYSAGMRFSERDQDGNISLNFTSENNLQIFDKLFNTISGNKSFYYVQNENETALRLFTSDNSLFLMLALDASETLRGMDTDFGIIPVPMLDVNQEDYISSNCGSSYFAIPITVRDAEMSSIILEALNFASYMDVKPVFYDVVLKSQTSRDEESQEMLDLIVEKTFIDFVFIYGINMNNIANLPWRLISNGQNTYASQIQANIQSVNTGFEKLIEYYK